MNTESTLAAAPATAESEGIDLVGYHDLDGNPAFKIAMQRANGRHYLYLSHFWRSAWSIVDVTDPGRPVLVRTIDGPPNTWTLQVQVADGLMINALERATPGWGFDPALTEKVGALIWDVATDPTNPKLLAHYDTTGRGTHRNYYAGGRYAYLAAEPEGFKGNILVILDLSDPSRPTEAGRWWWQGQWHAGGEQPEHDHYLHGPVYVVGNLAYLSYGRVGMVVLDVSDPTRPAFVSRLSFGDFGSALGCHSAIPYGPGIVVANSEALREGDTESLGYSVVVDVSEPESPRIMSWLPTPYPSEETGLTTYANKGARHGPHNQHQWQYQDCLMRDDTRVYLTHFNGGLRVYDISEPLRPREIAYYVPEDPKIRRGVKPVEALVTQFEDVLVDSRGYIYCTDKNHGLFVLRMPA
ncbi:hypothetical protein ITP53_03330 [Nonomuraea sp. K274]|uniref:LVIVD repeat-containing protein n=1 Tax=Nonomuraea cypriaca TaxID=1187855 RepID=A0A931EW31_9ACTN|nr:hypothetical protein [Nonomuraea cypriaca]MBF8184790.1 hypothetical protein [Nonomuraea cypriaca]